MFITIEGIEGSGKSTLIKGLEEKFAEHNIPLCKTREPGGSSLGAKIRPILLSSQGEKISPRAELLLFLADRAEHVDKVILPALAENKTVLCDRYIHSTIAYQGYARGLDLALLDTFMEFTCNNKLPDLTILLDLDVETGLIRAKGRNSNQELDEGKFEAEEKNFHEKVRRGFLTMARKENSNFFIVDATLPPTVIIEKVWEYINTFSLK